MKTTIDLPPDLVRAMKIKAARENRKLKDVVADLLRSGLSGSPAQASQPSRLPRSPFRKHPKTGHPVARVSRAAPAPPISVEESYHLAEDTLAKQDLEKLGLAV